MSIYLYSQLAVSAATRCRHLAVRSMLQAGEALGGHGHPFESDVCGQVSDIDVCGCDG
jgi:hypothetical protein